LDTNGASNIVLGIHLGTNANASTWSYDALKAYINLHNKGWTISKNGSTTEISYKITIANNGDSFNLKSSNFGFTTYSIDWGDGSSVAQTTSDDVTHTYSSSGTYVIKINTISGTYRVSFHGSTTVNTIISAAITINAANFSNRVYRAFRNLQNMTSYNQLSASTSSVVDFGVGWENCIGLTSFPQIDTSTGTTFTGTWSGCTGLTTFPSLAYSNAITFYAAWHNCSSLTTFPANQFNQTGTLLSSCFQFAWKNCALTAQSIENILTSLDTNGASNIILNIDGGTNAAYSTWSTAAQTAFANLSGDPSNPSDTGKGWTISYNTTSGTATNP